MKCQVKVAFGIDSSCNLSSLNKETWSVLNIVDMLRTVPCMKLKCKSYVFYFDLLSLSFVK